MEIGDIKVDLKVDKKTASQLLEIKHLAQELSQKIDLLLSSKNEDD